MKPFFAAALALILAAPAFSLPDDTAQARRSYRDECAKYDSYAWCECQASGLSQSLTQQEMRLATVSLHDRYEPANGQSVAMTGKASDLVIRERDDGVTDAFERIRDVEAGLTEPCAQFRGLPTRSGPSTPKPPDQKPPGATPLS
ncbi:MAG: hypothetical protein ABW199_12820 [Caulobacterales bacterium]